MNAKERSIVLLLGQCLFLSLAQYGANNQGRLAQLGRAAVLQAEGWRFKSFIGYQSFRRSVAQSAHEERAVWGREGEGSNPSAPTKLSTMAM